MLLGLICGFGAVLENAEAAPSPAVTKMGFYPGGKVASYLALESFVGHQTDYVVQFADSRTVQGFTGSVWGEVTDDGAFQTLNDRLKFVLSVPLTIGLRSPTTLAQRAEALRATQSGANDASIRLISKRLVEAGYPDAIIRLGWEFDGNWMPWSAVGNEALWVSTYRHVHDVMKSVSASFRFDLSGTPAWLPRAASAYPGDEYVDIIGMDVYDQPAGIAWNATSQTWNDPNAAWASILPKLQWHRDFAITHGKPVSYPEWGLSGVSSEVTKNVGGDNPTFIQGMYDWMNSLPLSGPGSLEYHAYFNDDAGSNHRIDAGQFPDAAARFRALFGNTTPMTSARPATTTPANTPTTIAPATTTTPTAPSTTATTVPTPTTTVPADTPSNGRDIEAQYATTNAEVESTNSGSESSAYVRLAGVDGEYLRFAFAASEGPAVFSLRYSSSPQDAFRTIRIDGEVVIPRQRFAWTRTWSRWKTLSVETELTAGTHTLEIVYDSAEGSKNPLNIDNIKISSSQVLAAGEADTNIATESRWPGAESPPYVCCWDQQGQYVEFSFSTGSGPTNLALRYSAGNDVAFRTVILDGFVLQAQQAFPKTADWSTWETLSMNMNLTAGRHTLEIVYDEVEGSSQFLNLDNLRISAT